MDTHSNLSTKGKGRIEPISNSMVRPSSPNKNHSGRKIMTPEQKKTAKNLYFKGASLRKIQEVTGLSNGTIRYHFDKKRRKQIIASSKKWQEKNPEKKKEQVKRWREKHPERVLHAVCLSTIKLALRKKVVTIEEIKKLLRT